MAVIRVITHAPHLAPKVPPKEIPVLPSLSTKYRRLGVALKTWHDAGMPVANRQTRKHRATVCKACPHWLPGGNLGLGECRAPGCGCTSLKRWLATERCPLAKWT